MRSDRIGLPLARAASCAAAEIRVPVQPRHGRVALRRDLVDERGQPLALGTARGIVGPQDPLEPRGSLGAQSSDVGIAHRLHRHGVALLGARFGRGIGRFARTAQRCDDDRQQHARAT